MGKYKSACSSLRPGQLDKLMEKIPKEEIDLSNQTKGYMEAVHKISNALRKKADSYNDAEGIAWTAEMFLLRKVFEAANDLIEGKTSPVFCRVCGGSEALEQKLAGSVSAMQEWYWDGEG